MFIVVCAVLGSFLALHIGHLDGLVVRLLNGRNCIRRGGVDAVAKIVVIESEKEIAAVRP